MRWLACVSLAVIICVLPVCRGTYVRSYSGEDAISEEALNDDIADITVLEDVKENEAKSTVSPIAEDGCSAAARRNTDEYVDKVLEEVRPKLPDPAFLPERVGRFRLFNGTLDNLSSVRRTGPALVRCTERTFSFLVPVSFRNLTGRYFWETDAGVPVFRGFIDVLIGRVDADVLYSRRHAAEEGSQKAVVDTLAITRLEGAYVKFDGLGPLNRIASRLTNLVVRFFNRGVSRALEGPVKNAINKELKNVDKYEKYYF